MFLPWVCGLPPSPDATQHPTQYHHALSESSLSSLLYLPSNINHPEYQFAVWDGIHIKDRHMMDHTPKSYDQMFACCYATFPTITIGYVDYHCKRSWEVNKRTLFHVWVSQLFENGPLTQPNSICLPLVQICQHLCVQRSSCVLFCWDKGRCVAYRHLCHTRWCRHQHLSLHPWHHWCML